jgi:hypothetical protein
MDRGIEGTRWSEGWGVEGTRWSEGRGVEGTWWSGVGRPGARGRALGIWGRGVEGGGGGAELGSGVEGGGGGGTELGGGVEGGGGTEVGQPDGAKLNFTTIRVSRRWGYSPYTRYYWYRLT